MNKQRLSPQFLRDLDDLSKATFFQGYRIFARATRVPPGAMKSDRCKTRPLETFAI